MATPGPAHRVRIDRGGGAPVFHPAEAQPPRPTDRGAVVLEALLVISTLVLIFVGLVYVQGVYERQIQVLQASRTYSMAYALGACDEDPMGALFPDDAATLTPGDLASGSDPLGGSRPSGDPNAERALGAATRNSGLTLPREVSTRAAATVVGPLHSRSVKTSGTGQSFGTTVSSTDRILCGDKAHDEGVLGMVELAIDFLRMK